MSTQIDILIQLKNQLVTFLDELIELFPNEPDFVIFRIFIKDRIPIESIMEYIVGNLCPLHNMVKSRDESFFLNNNILFENFSETENTKVNHFKNIWTSNSLDAHDKEVIWKWFQTFIYLGNKYLQLKK